MRSKLLAAAVCLTIASTAQARPDDKAFDRAANAVADLADAAQAVPGASPALALIIVRKSGEPTIRVGGRVDAGGPLPAGEDTPFYIASMTKAYVGLLAVELDRKGVLPLDTTLAQIWPGLAIPGVPNAGSVTLRELLSHRVPFRVPTLNYRTAYTDDVPATAYRGLLEAYAEPHDPAYAYSNLGYLVYGAAAELRTGHHWRDLLKTHLLTPLSLKRTSPVISDFKPGTVALGHQWRIDGFHPVRKSDALMHAAGGIVSSPRDMARWLQAWLRQDGGTIPPSSFLVASTPISFGEDGSEGITCTGYALGWHICDAGGAAVHLHGGGYPGVRAVMGWSQDLDAGIAVLTNSDSMTGGLSAQLLRIFFSALADPAAELPEPAVFAQRYAERVRTLAENRKREVAESRALAQWGGWSWSPDEAQLRAIAGPYRNPRLGRMVVSFGAEGLVAELGELNLRLEPAAANLFAAIESPLSPPEPLRVEAAADGRPAAILWSDERFIRE